MGSTYYSLHYHWICSTKERRRLIRPEWRSQFHQYLGGAIRGLGGTPLNVGGVEDHVHALVGLKATHCIADMAREMKKASSTWAAQNCDREFSWQEGYSVFSVSASLVDSVRQYIDRQEEHHKKVSFVDELKRFLEKHKIQFDPKYLV